MSEPKQPEEVFYLEEQPDGSQQMFNGYFEVLKKYPDLMAAKHDLHPNTVGEPYEDIGGFTMREVKDDD